ncbi:HelD family protein [Phytoactinopolyspora halophila]|nr:AAA family ATPase [Phytoactinopolyspora halophila]
MTSTDDEIATEQDTITAIYKRFDALREKADHRFSSAIQPTQVSTPGGKLERNIRAQHFSERAAQLSAAEHGLVIGRLDLDHDEHFYIGRTGLYSEDYDPLLIDWRAPAATPFYRATPMERLGVRRRRHIHLKGRRVVRLDDDILAIDELDDDERQHLTGEAALLSSLQSARTGRMADIVATIQAEQDRIIRSELDGILVVEGGPGTGKTVVALHRAAYLLYTHRDQLAKSGVLVVGPNATFLRYIDQVLPGLGETDVVLASMGDLYPGVETSRTDAPFAAAVKGSLRMADVLEQAVTRHERIPPGSLKVTTDRDTYLLDEETCQRILDETRERAERTRQPHNRMRQFVAKKVLNELVRQEYERLDSVLDGIDIPLEADDEEDRDLGELIDQNALYREFRTSPSVREALDILWPELTPQRVLTDLYTDPDFRAAVTPQLSQAERDALHRADATAWTISDVPLLDELATLVGELDATINRAERRRRQAEAARSQHIEEQRQLVHDAYDVAMDMAIDEEVTMPVDASLVLERYHDVDDRGFLAERARQDREWEYGHVIVDEAQELSPMAWRLLVRRCPSRSMTAVGDIAQTGAPDSPGSWSEVLDPVAPGQWRRGQLTVNYRTTEQIMNVAADVLAASGADAVAPRSVRPDGEKPWAWQVTDDELADALPGLVREERVHLETGTMAVLAPRSRIDSVLASVRHACPEATTGDDENVLDAPVAVLTPAQAKGLEFDGTIVVAPDEIVAGSSRGYSDLYVALTRPTRRLGVVATGPLPDGLAHLR